ncbi:MAG: redoxin domain-containing protein, partial [Rhodanobacteraceae bacterium]
RRSGYEVEWKIVLAKVVGDEPPKIIVDRISPGASVVRRDAGGDTTAPARIGPLPGMLRLSYRDGRYFIRDEAGSLRSLREPKTETAPWPKVEMPARDAKGFGSGMAGSARSVLAGQVSDSWITVAAGPQRTREKGIVADCLVRVAHQDLHEASGMKFSGAPGLARFTYGPRFVIDDGDLLVAEKLDAWQLPFELKRLAQRDPALAARLAMQKLAGSPPPELSGETWLNVDEPPTWKSLRGKPALLVLFDLKQPSFAPLVPPLLAFEETYGKQGLAVIGVYAKRPRGEVEKLLTDERINFPVLIDDGKTAERYGLGYSACVLIDREGNVASVYTNS